jgi:ribonuclease P protein component
MAGFSVPKKKFGSSVHRHRIRRLMAEAWRLNKHVLYELTPDHIQLQLFFICTDKNMPAYADVEKAVVLAIEQLKKVVRAKVV